MIYFDRKTLAVLRRIKRGRKKGVGWGELQRKYKDAADSALLAEFTRELYTVSTDKDGRYLSFGKDWDHVILPGFRSYITPKGLELIETRCFAFWRWVIPTLVSVAALAVSVLGAIY